MKFSNNVPRLSLSNYTNYRWSTWSISKSVNVCICELGFANMEVKRIIKKCNQFQLLVPRKYKEFILKHFFQV